MKKIILRAPLLTKSGYAEHSRQVARWLLNLEKQGKVQVFFNTVAWGITPFYVDPNACDGLIGQIMQRLTGETNGFDVSIQLQLPSEWNPFLANYNIGITAGVETTICNPQWIEAINRMDLVIVPSEFTKKTFLDSGEVTTKIEVVGESWLEACGKIIDPQENVLVNKLDLKTDFNFLIVSQITGNNPENDRKNIAYTIKWMLEEFKDDPNVGLIVKTNFGRDTTIDNKMVCQTISQILLECKKGPGPRVYVLHGLMTDKEMASLYQHPKVKAIINLTRGEGFCGLDYTPIYTNNGIKRLDEVGLNDFVLTHKNRFRKVTKLMNRDYSGEMIRITPYSNVNNQNPITLTPNHNVYVYDSETDKFSWKEAGELTKKDRLCIPKGNKEKVTVHELKISDYIKDKNIVINNVNGEEKLQYIHSNGLGREIKNTIEVNNDLGRLFGYFLSEGNSSNERGVLHFSLHKKEKETIAKDIENCFENIFGLKNIKITTKNNKCAVKLNSKFLSDFFVNLFGHGAKNKSIPNELIYNSSDEFKRGLLAGIFAGDGYISAGNEAFTLQLANNKLIRQIRILLMQQNIPCSFSESRKTGIIKNKYPYDGLYTKIIVSSQDSKKTLSNILKENLFWFDVSPAKRKRDTGKRIVSNDDFIVMKIKKLETIQHEGKVYNISVEEDESYCTENFMVHNCLPLAEAAVSGLPVIATGWSAHTEYLNKGKYIKVDYNLIDVHPSRIDNNIFIQGAKWANPLEEDFKRKVRRFYKASDIPRQWAKELREKMLVEYSPEAIENLYTEKLKDVIF
jgi:intein/homing endonuclease